MRYLIYLIFLTSFYAQLGLGADSFDQIPGEDHRDNSSSGTTDEEREDKVEENKEIRQPVLLDLEEDFAFDLLWKNLVEGIRDNTTSYYLYEINRLVTSESIVLEELIKSIRQNITFIKRIKASFTVNEYKIYLLLMRNVLQSYQLDNQIKGNILLFLQELYLKFDYTLAKVDSKDAKIIAQILSEIIDLSDKMVQQASSYKLSELFLPFIDITQQILTAYTEFLRPEKVEHIEDLESEFRGFKLIAQSSYDAYTGYSVLGYTSKYPIYFVVDSNNNLVIFFGGHLGGRDKLGASIWPSAITSTKTKLEGVGDIIKASDSAISSISKAFATNFNLAPENYNKIRFIGHGWHGAFAEISAYYMSKIGFSENPENSEKVQSISFGTSGYLTENGKKSFEIEMAGKNIRFRLTDDTIAPNAYFCSFTTRCVADFGGIFEVKRYQTESVHNALMDGVHSLTHYNWNLTSDGFFGEHVVMHQIKHRARSEYNLLGSVKGLKIISGIVAENIQKGRKNLLDNAFAYSDRRVFELDIDSSFGSSSSDVHVKKKKSKHIVLKSAFDQIEEEMDKEGNNEEAFLKALAKIDENRKKTVEFMLPQSLYNKLIEFLAERIKSSRSYRLLADYIENSKLRNNKSDLFIFNVAKAELNVLLKIAGSGTNGLTGTVIHKDFLSKEPIAIFKGLNSESCGTIKGYVGQRSALTQHPYGQAANEFLGFLVSMGLGYDDLVPMAIYIDDTIGDTHIQGTFIEFIGTHKSISKFATFAGKSKDLKLAFLKLSILDIILANLDRKSDNLFIEIEESEDRYMAPIVAIDNANILPIRVYKSSNLFGWNDSSLAQTKFASFLEALQFPENSLVTTEYSGNIFDFVSDTISKLQRLVAESAGKTYLEESTALDFLAKRIEIVNKILAGESEISSPSEITKDMAF